MTVGFPSANAFGADENFARGGDAGQEARREEREEDDGQHEIARARAHGHRAEERACRGDARVNLSRASAKAGLRHRQRVAHGLADQSRLTLTHVREYRKREDFTGAHRSVERYKHESVDLRVRVFFGGL